MVQNKRHFSLFLVLSLVLSLLILGCGSSGSSSSSSAKKEMTTSTTKIYNKVSLSFTFPKEGFVYSESSEDLKAINQNTAIALIKAPTYNIVISFSNGYDSSSYGKGWEGFQKAMRNHTQFPIGDIKAIAYEYSGEYIVALPPTGASKIIPRISVLPNSIVKFRADNKGGVRAGDPELEKLKKESKELFDSAEVQAIIKSVKFTEIKK